MPVADPAPSQPPDEEEEHASFLDRFPALERLGLRGRQRRIPVIQQLTAVECGAACLAMTLGYYGKAVPVEELREVMGIGRDASSALTILNTGQYYGLRGRGVKLDIDDLEYLDEGSILHWEFNH